MMPLDQHRDNPNFIKIWIRFAEMQAYVVLFCNGAGYLDAWLDRDVCCRTKKSARDTFAFMLAQRIGQRDPKVYSAYASFEGKQGSFSVFL